MKKISVHKLLEAHKNERGIANWKKFAYANWTSYGIGLTQLKKLAKQVGRNHTLAKELWVEPNYDVKIISVLIEEPKKVGEPQIEAMVTDVSMWMISHIWVQNLFSKVPFAKQFAANWRKEKDAIKRRCGFAYLYYLVKDKKTTDNYFYPIIDEIKTNIQTEENFVKDAMNNALFAIGQRSKELNFKCIEASKAIGKIVVDYGDNSCEAVDVFKHLTSDRIQNKFG